MSLDWIVGCWIVKKPDTNYVRVVCKTLFNQHLCFTFELFVFQ
jgi:hypothetical protein